MKLMISSRCAANAACAAVTARVFLGLIVDLPTMHNGVWLSALLGALMAAPLVSGMRSLQIPQRTLKRPMTAALLFIVLLANLIDAAHAMSGVVRSTGYLALERSPTVLLLLPLALAVYWSVSRNGDTVGYSAAVWTRAFFGLIALIALLQWRDYRPEWLRPVLGDGISPILRGALRTAGWIASICGVFPISASSDSGKSPSLSFLLIGIATAIMLILLRLMMTPTFNADRPETWLMRMDSLLTNGRGALYLQLPLIVAWYAGLLHLTACESFCAAAIAQRCLPGLDGRLCALLVVGVAAGMAANSALIDALVNLTAPWLFPAIGLMTALATLERLKGGKSACAAE